MQQGAKVAELVEFTKALTEEIPIWRQIAAITREQRAKIVDIRAGRYVCLEGEGLVILGCIGFELLNYAPNGTWREYARKLGSINWRESEPIWTSTIRERVEKLDPKTGQPSVTYKKLSAYSAVAAAIENVRAAIGWTKPDPLAPFPSAGPDLEQIEPSELVASSV
jgi:hypothetical protein